MYILVSVQIADFDCFSLQTNTRASCCRELVDTSRQSTHDDSAQLSVPRTTLSVSVCAVFRCCFGVVVVGVTLRMKFDMSCLCTEQCLLFRNDSRQCSGCCKSMLVCCLSRVSERNGVSASPKKKSLTFLTTCIRQAFKLNTVNQFSF